MQGRADFFKPITITNIEVAKFFIELKARFNSQEISEKINKLHERLHSKISSDWEKLEETLKQSWNFETFSKMQLFYDLHHDLLYFAYFGLLARFEATLYAMSTLITPAEIIARLKAGHSCSSCHWSSVAIQLLKGIHAATAHCDGDLATQEEKYKSSDICQQHKQIIDILKTLGFHEMLMQNTEKDKRPFFYTYSKRYEFGSCSGYEMMIPEDMFEYIQRQCIGLSPASKLC